MDDLEPSLARAVQTIRAETLPDDAVARVIDRARRLDVVFAGVRPVAIGPRPRVLLVGDAAARGLAVPRARPPWRLPCCWQFSFFRRYKCLACRDVGGAWPPGPGSTRRRPTPAADGPPRPSPGCRPRIAAPRSNLATTATFVDMETGISLDYDAKDGTINRTAWLHQGAERAPEAQLPGLLDRLIADQGRLAPVVSRRTGHQGRAKRRTAER